MTKLKCFRKQRGLNQRQLSEVSHTPQSLVSAIERGVMKPWPRVAQRLSKALNIPIEQLFPDEGNELKHG